MNRNLLAIFIVAIVIRVVLIAMPGYVWDIGAFEQWATIIATHGPLAIYSASAAPRVDYPPGYLYALWDAGLTHRLFGGGEIGFRIVLKIIPIASDLVLIGLVYRVTSRMATQRAALWVGAAVAVLPPLWLDSTLYGQADAVPIVFALLALDTMLAGNLALTLPLLAASILIKPQSLLIAPTIAVLFARAKHGTAGLAIGVPGALVLAYLCVLPFTTLRFPPDVLRYLCSLYAYGIAKAPLTTNGAFNLYAIITKFYSTDSQRIGPVTYYAFGTALVAILTIANAMLLARSLVRFPAENRRYARVFGCASLSLLALFLFATRMHERYLLPALVFGAPLAADDIPTAAAMLWLACTFTANLAFIMVGFYGGAHHPLTLRAAQAAAIGNIVAFGVLSQRQWQRLFSRAPVNGAADCR